MIDHVDHHPGLSSSDWYRAVLIIALLVAIYSITYSGTFITDDEHILASRTLALAFDGEFNDLRVYGNSRVFFLSQLNPGYAEQGTGIEPAQSFLGSFIARIAALFNLGRVQAIFLLNIWITALTAAVIFAAIRIEGYSRRTGLVVALLFGLASIAWPYSQTYFRDPLAMFFLSIAWVAALVVSAKGNGQRLAAWLVFFVALIGGILAKNTVLLAFPVLILMILTRIWRNEKDRNLRSFWKKHRRMVTLIGVALLVLIAATLALPRESALARFTFSYYSSVIKYFLETPHANFWTAIAGPFISPGKSIFLTTPVLLLGLLGLFKNWRRVWPAWFYLILLVVAQALFYDSGWWGSINWGLRFTLPAIPLLIITLAPVVEKWFEIRFGRVMISALAIVSVLIQLVALLPPIRDYYVQLYRASSPASETLSLWTFKHSALSWHLGWLFSGGTWDIAAMRIGTAAIAVLVGYACIVTLAIRGITFDNRRWLALFLVMICLGMNAFMLYTYKDDPAYHPTRGDLTETIETVSANTTPNDLLLVKSYGTSAWYNVMNNAPANVRWVSLPYAFPSLNALELPNQTGNLAFALDELTLHLFKNELVAYNHVWLMTPDDSPSVELGLEAAWLESHSSFIENWGFTSDDHNTELYRFTLDPSHWP